MDACKPIQFTTPAQLIASAAGIIATAAGILATLIFL